MGLKKINLVAADMGYGHQRAAYPLLDLSGGEVITINDYKGILDWEKKYWIDSLRSYEKISRLNKIPVFGSAVFAVMDAFQKIHDFYPFRDLSRPTVQQEYFFKFIKKGLGKALIEKLNKNKLPFVTTFFVAAYIAEYYNYQGDIYCIICDTDASRAWAPLHPALSKTKFLVPSEKVRTRFLMYGVKPENIIVSGFPLPKENVGAHQEIAKHDLGARLSRLDPSGKYSNTYKPLISSLKFKKDTTKRPLTLMFAVGGAGAQKEIGALILKKLAASIKAKKINLNLIAGNRLEIKDYFQEHIKINQLKEGNGVKVIFASDKLKYFKMFNLALRETDVLWTKPSELSFYAALGLPIIMSAPVGSQEDFNREWLLNIGAGIDSPEAEFVDEWLPDLLSSGRLARAAVDGFLNANNLGAYNIEKILLKKK